MKSYGKLALALLILTGLVFQLDSVNPSQITTSQTTHALSSVCVEVPTLPECMMPACSPIMGTACVSPANACGETAPGIYDCAGICNAVPPTPADTNENGTPDCLEVSCNELSGSSCVSAANVCGESASGVYSCEGVCDAATPAPADRNENGTADCLEPAPFVDIAVTKTANVSSIVAGGLITYTITYQNIGSTRANGFDIFDRLPAGTQFVSSSTEGSREGDTLQWMYKGMDAGESATITVVVDTTGLPLGPITNTVEVSNRCYRISSSDMVIGIQNFIVTRPYMPESYCDENESNDIATAVVQIVAPSNGFGGGQGGGGGGSPAPTLLDTGAPSTGSNNTGSSDTGTVVPPVETPKAPRSDAYEFGQSNDITSMPTYDEARLQAKIVRGEVAKMISKFYQNVLKKEIVHIDACNPSNYNDFATTDEETRGYIYDACSVGLMGWKNDKKSILDAFRPSDFITKAEFSAILSRMLYNTVSDDASEEWYAPHFAALKEHGILDDISNPNENEIRGNVLAMLLKASNLIK